MFCEKCGVQIPDGGDTMCPNCRLRFGAGQNFGQPVQPVQPMVQPVQQPAAANSGFSLNTITGNPMIMMVIKLALGAISLWAAFGPLLKFIGKGLVSFSFMEVYTMTSMAGGKAASAALAGYFVPLLIMMILAILLALAGITLTILPKVAPQVKLPLPSCASYAATVFALILAIISDFITIGFTATAKVPFTGFGVFMIILSFLALAGTVFMSYVELKKK